MRRFFMVILLAILCLILIFGCEKKKGKSSPGSTTLASKGVPGFIVRLKWINFPAIKLIARIFRNP
ncbi:MAG: hypothetical protein ABIH42_07150 [Planctomycetota bacterium]